MKRHSNMLFKLASSDTFSTWAFNANGKECKPHLQLGNVMLMEDN